MKKLHTFTAFIEAGAGVALIGFPSVAVKLLFGSSFDGAATMALGRLCGAALFTLGIVCWLARGDAHSRAARGLAAGMLFYNVAAAAIFIFAGLGQKLAGIALWPAIILHTVMAIWCIRCLRCKLADKPEEQI